MAPGIYVPKYHQKVSGDCGGGGGEIKLGRSSTGTAQIYKSQIILSLDNNNDFYIMKNRYGEEGNTTIDGALNIIANMLTQSVFDGTMDMFQETMKMKIIEALKPIVSGKDIIPKGDLNENTIQRKSRRNGAGHNSLLQGFVQLRR